MSGENRQEDQQNKGNTGDKGNKQHAIQNGDVTVTAVLVYEDHNGTHFVYKLLRDSEDGKIGPLQDIDFKFPWETVNVKN